jgi:hypothetical protein
LKPRNYRGIERKELLTVACPLTKDGDRAVTCKSVY